MGELSLKLYNTKVNMEIENDIEGSKLLRHFCSLMFTQGYLLSSIITCLENTLDDLKEEVDFSNGN